MLRKKNEFVQSDVIGGREEGKSPAYLEAIVI